MAYNTNSHIRFVKVKVTITGPKDTATIKKADERNKGVIFKDCDHLLIAKVK